MRMGQCTHWHCSLCLVHRLHINQFGWCTNILYTFQSNCKTVSVKSIFNDHNVQKRTQKLLQKCATFPLAFVPLTLKWWLEPRRRFWFWNWQRRIQLYSQLNDKWILINFLGIGSINTFQWQCVQNLHYFQMGNTQKVSSRLLITIIILWIFFSFFFFCFLLSQMYAELLIFVPINTSPHA